MRVFRHLLVIALYFAIALIIVGQNPLLLIDNFIGTDTGDTYEMARNIWWFTFAIEQGEPLFYQTWLGYPDGINGAVLLSVPLQYFPMWGLAFFLPLPLAYNLVVLFWMALNGWSVYFLMRYLLNRNDSLIPALIAGLVYMAFPVFQGHLAEGHAGLMVAWGAPLYIWALFRLTTTQEHFWRWLGITILFFYVSTTGHILQSIYVLIPVTGTFLLAKLYLRDWEAVKRIMGMGMLASIIVLVVLSPAILDATSQTSYTSTGGYSRYSADLLAVVTPSFLNPVVDSLVQYPRRVLGTNLAEGASYLGVIAFALSIIGIVQVKDSRWWLLLGVIAWIFSLGTVLKIFDQPILINGNPIPLPFALLPNLPGFSLARAPARFNFTLAIAIAVMVGYGMAWLWHNKTGWWRYPLALILSVGILAEYQLYFPQPLRTGEMPQAVVDLRDDETIEAIFNIPYQHALAAKDALFYQTGHQHPLIAGQITRSTPVNPAMLAMLQITLDPVLLNDVGADIVMLHRSRAREIGEFELLEALANQQLGIPFYQDDEIALYRVPELTSTDTINYEIERPLIDLSGDMTLLGEGVYEWDNLTYVWLQWSFDSQRPDTDVRFIHIINEDNEIVLQDDSSLGIIQEDDVRTELLTFDTNTLPAGTYRIRVGWYDFNTLTNYLTDDGQAAIIISEIVVSE